MSAEILLDCQGDLPAPTGYQIIEREVDFLRYATDDSPLLIRGERLCTWAESFFHLRGRLCRYQKSLSTALRDTFPALSQEQSQALAQRLGQTPVAQEEISAIFILNRCYPTDTLLWRDSPSREHAAHWLLWILTHQPDAAEQVILERFSAALARKAGNGLERHLYEARDRTDAQKWLYRWLSLEQTQDAINLGEFPLSLPRELESQIKDEWMRRVIASKGQYFRQTLPFPLPIHLRRELAVLTARFYQEHPPVLTREIVWQLQPYLSSETLSQLRKTIPPQQPSPLPVGELAALEWFQTEYLPYRRWQADHGDEQAQEPVRQRATDFAHWYLERFPQWLLQPQWISFQQTAKLQELDGTTVTLCVILDGLPAWDAEDFVGQMAAGIERLHLQQKTYCFAPLPTVTDFAKDALLKGKPPRLAPLYPALGDIVSDKDSPLSKLQSAQPGDLIFWRVAQPDEAYHRESDNKRERQVRAELDVILQEIRKVSENLPDATPLQVIITSDHGRLLNAKSPRALPTPQNMQAHGRVAWGTLDQDFEECGYAIDEAKGIIVVNGNRFEMAHDMVIALDERSFKDTKGGYEPYPHGGLYPEEAIVPWFVFRRDAEPPRLEIAVSGTGETGNIGALTITVMNSSRLILECLSITLSHSPDAEACGQWTIAPVDQTIHTVNIKPWPADADKKDLKAILLLRQPNGVIFTYETTPVIEIKELYKRDDSLWKDLGL